MNRGWPYVWKIAAVAAALGLSGCSTVVVETQTVSAAEVAAARSYAFLGGRTLHASDQVADERLRADLDAMVRRELAAVGLQPAAGGQSADLVVQYWVSLDANGVPVKPAGMANDFGGPSVVPRAAPSVGMPGPEGTNTEMPPQLIASYREGMLVLDLLGPQTRNLLWRGTVTLDVGSDRSKSLADLESGLVRSLRRLPRQ